MQVHHSKNNTNNITGPWNLETNINGRERGEGGRKEKEKDRQEGVD